MSYWVVGLGKATSNGVAREDLKGSNLEELEEVFWAEELATAKPLGLASAGRKRRRVWLVLGDTIMMSFTWLHW